MANLMGQCALKPSSRDPVETCLDLHRHAAGNPVYALRGEPARESGSPWRISPEPFCVSKQSYLYLKALGNHLLRFYQAANQLYLDSVRGHQEAWIAAYLDHGKPEHVIEFGRMNRQKRLLPALIRPDLVYTEDHRWVACEFDSIPGGQGFVGSLSEAYHQQGFDVLGGGEGILDGFMRLVRANVGEGGDPFVAIVVSQESNDYLAELTWLAGALRQRKGLRIEVVAPQDLRYADDALWVADRRVDMIYRFFELFDLKNIPRAELIMYAAKKQQVVVTPPFKAQLEEKMWFALFHHPALEAWWRTSLGPETFAALQTLIPRTWILDPRPLPPHAVIPGLSVGDRPVRRWTDLEATTKKQREFVVKPSGFSELAWGSRGISFGSDTPQAEWGDRLREAVAAFDQVPHLLQEYHKPVKVQGRYLDLASREIRTFMGRARLCPYYYVEGEQAHLHGILVTLVPADKKAIHGMSEAVMMPAMVE